MNLDIRLPIGLMFTLFGAILVAYGLVSSPAIYTRSLGININLNWGGVMLVTGLVLLYFGRRAGQKA